MYIIMPVQHVRLALLGEKGLLLGGKLGGRGWPAAVAPATVNDSTVTVTGFAIRTLFVIVMVTLPSGSVPTKLSSLKPICNSNNYKKNNQYIHVQKLLIWTSQTFIPLPYGWKISRVENFVQFQILPYLENFAGINSTFHVYKFRVMSHPRKIWN